MKVIAKEEGEKCFFLSFFLFFFEFVMKF